MLPSTPQKSIYRSAFPSDCEQKALAKWLIHLYIVFNVGINK